MRIKKVVSFVLVVTMLFALAISTFADSRAINGDLYSAGKVRHRFTTSATATKDTSEFWTKAVDNAASSYFYTEGNEDNATKGCHTTYVVDGNGTKITSGKEVGFSATVTFYVSEMNIAPNTNTLRLQIYNPMYGSSGTTQILKTTGLFTATTN